MLSPTCHSRQAMQHQLYTHLEYLSIEMLPTFSLSLTSRQVPTKINLFPWGQMFCQSYYHPPVELLNG